MFVVRTPKGVVRTKVPPQRLNKPQSWAYRHWKPGHTVVKPWGRGTGKSHFDRFALWVLVALLDGKHRSDQPAPFGGPCPTPLYGVRINVLCDTLAHFKEIHRSVIEAELAPSGPWGCLRGRLDRSTMGIRFPGGSEVRVFPALEHTATKGRGARCDVVWVEEADDVPAGTYHAIALPWSSEPWSLRMTSVSGTPTRGRHGLLFALHKQGLDPAAERIHSLHATYRDAPETVAPQAVEDARRLMLPSTFAREWECDFDAGEGLVYDVFNPELSVREASTRDFSQIAIGTDWGYTDPHVFLVAGIVGHGEDAQVWVLEEHYESGHTLDHWEAVARRIVERFDSRCPITFFCDPSRPDSIRSIANASGRHAEGVKNKIEDGITTVAQLMMPRGPIDEKTGEFLPGRVQPRLYIDPRCENTLREIDEYRRKRDPRDRERFQEAPEDKHNHAMDALRYLCVGAFDTVVDTELLTFGGRYS